MVNFSLMTLNPPFFAASLTLLLHTSIHARICSFLFPFCFVRGTFFGKKSESEELSFKGTKLYTMFGLMFIILKSIALCEKTILLAYEKKESMVIFFIHKT